MDNNYGCLLQITTYDGNSYKGHLYGIDFEKKTVSLIHVNAMENDLIILYAHVILDCKCIRFITVLNSEYESKIKLMLFDKRIVIGTLVNINVKGHSSIYLTAIKIYYDQGVKYLLSSHVQKFLIKNCKNIVLLDEFKSYKSPVIKFGLIDAISFYNDSLTNEKINKEKKENDLNNDSNINRQTSIDDPKPLINAQDNAVSSKLDTCKNVYIYLESDILDGTVIPDFENTNNIKINNIFGSRHIENYIMDEYKKFLLYKHIIVKSNDGRIIYVNNKYIRDDQMKNKISEIMKNSTNNVYTYKTDETLIDILSTKLTQGEHIIINKPDSSKKMLGEKDK